MNVPPGPAADRAAPLIIGTAGHVDHGKTVLVRALTGQETDRLPEEQARGISIDLGFAHFTLPSGRPMAIIDVPGHERFIRNMVAGASGVDLALLVVAADEGPMPQTYEHLDILDLLELQAGVIVITKTDLVEEAWLELVRDELRDLTKGTCLENAPMAAVSAETGKGIERLVKTVAEVAANVPGRPPGAFPRLPIDRIFSLAGFGTVVTGTLLSGSLRPDQTLEVLPAGREVRVRGLQVHGEDVEVVTAARRVAVNLSGVETDELARGDVLAEPDLLAATPGFAAHFRHLPSAQRPLETGQRVRVHVGTAELIGRIHLLDAESLAPGEEGYIQFRGESPTVTVAGDPYVVRTYSPMRTVGGGRVLDPARRYRRFDDEGLAWLDRRQQGEAQRLLAELSQATPRPRQAAEVGRQVFLGPRTSRQLAAELVAKGEAVELDGQLLLATQRLAALRARMQGALQAFHQEQRLRRGMPRQALRQHLMPQADPRAFNALLAYLADQGDVRLEDEAVAHSQWQVELTAEEEDARERLLQRLAADPYEPPDGPGLLAGLPLAPAQARQLLHYLEESGEAVAIDDDLYLHRDAFASAWQAAAAYLEEHGRITVAQLRDVLGTTRKYAVPLLETFDARRYTRRLGDERRLRQQERP